MKPDLDATLRRIIGNTRVTFNDQALGPPVKCIRCRDYGVVEWTSGEYRTDRGTPMTATPEKPVYTKCSCTDRVEGDTPRARKFRAG